MSSDTPTVVCLHVFASRAARHCPDQPERGRSSAHVPVIFGSPVWLGDSTYKIFDVFPDDSGHDAHLSGTGRYAAPRWNPYAGFPGFDEAEWLSRLAA
jgi:hypothetical protein